MNDRTSSVVVAVDGSFVVAIKKCISKADDLPNNVVIVVKTSHDGHLTKDRI